MRLKQEEPSALVFGGRGPVLPPIWVGLALLVGPASLALFAPGPITAPRLGTATLIAALGLLLVTRSWPRAIRATLDPRARVVVTGGRRRAFTEAASYHLVPVAPRTPGGRPVYGVALSPSGGTDTVLLVATTDPGEALADLARMQAALRLPVRGGWGLPSGAPWVDGEPPPSGPPDGGVTEERAGRRRAVTTLLVGSVAIGLGIARTVRGRMLEGDSPSVLSLVLPALGVIALAVIACVLGTAEVSVRVDGSLVVEKRVFGVAFSRKTLPLDTIRCAYLVSPNGGTPRHLLVDTREGPLAFPYDVESGGDLGALLSR